MVQRKYTEPTARSGVTSTVQLVNELSTLQFVQYQHRKDSEVYS